LLTKRISKDKITFAEFCGDFVLLNGYDLIRLSDFQTIGKAVDGVGFGYKEFYAVLNADGTFLGRK
jgi:hypothetical protein